MDTWVVYCAYAMRAAGCVYDDVRESDGMRSIMGGGDTAGRARTRSPLRLQPIAPRRASPTPTAHPSPACIDVRDTPCFPAKNLPSDLRLEATLRHCSIGKIDRKAVAPACCACLSFRRVVLGAGAAQGVPHRAPFAGVLRRQRHPMLSREKSPVRFSFKGNP